MSQEIDRRIAALEQELSALRRQKLLALEKEMASLNAQLHGNGETVPAGPRRGQPPKSAEKASVTAALPAGRRKKKTRGKYVSDDDALALLTQAVKAASAEGISAKAAGEEVGLSYPRVIKLMDANFNKSGSGKWTRYTA